MSKRGQIQRSYCRDLLAATWKLCKVGSIAGWYLSSPLLCNAAACGALLCMAEAWGKGQETYPLVVLHRAGYF